jgi:hypothetical protein
MVAPSTEATMIRFAQAGHLARGLALLACMLAVGCEGREEKQAAPKPEAKPAEKRKSNIVKITTPVPYGKHVACENIFDAAKFAELTALDIGRLSDRSASNSEMTSVCAFFRAGEPPKTDAQLRAFQKNDRKLGVIPGDEYCTVSINCSITASPETLKKRCEEDAKTAIGMTQYEDNEDLGQYSCVRKTDRPPSDWAFTYRTVDSDTQCLVEVMGGPSVVSEELVQKCTNAGMQLLTKESIATFQ